MEQMLRLWNHTRRCQTSYDVVCCRKRGPGFSEPHAPLRRLRPREPVPSRSEVALKGHRTELEIGVCGDVTCQVDGGFLGLGVLEEMGVSFLLIWNNSALIRD